MEGNLFSFCIKNFKEFTKEIEIIVFQPLIHGSFLPGSSTEGEKDKTVEIRHP